MADPAREERRFWPKVQEMPDGCWHWTGALREKGYGSFMRAKGSNMAHRFAYELLVGPIPDGLCIDHLCEVKKCVNPAHMELVTPRENLRRGAERRRSCRRGHEINSENARYSQGRRYCRVCEREKARRYRLAAISPEQVTDK